MKFITNLNGTILCPYQILLDIAEQIPNSPATIKNLAFAPICDLNTTNDWINLESLGKPVAIRAKMICDLVCSLLKHQDTSNLTLEVYCHDDQLTSDNLYSLLFLAQTLNSLEISFFTPNPAQDGLKSKIDSLNAEKNVTVHYQADTNPADSLTLLTQARQKTISTLGFALHDNILHSPEFSEALSNQLIGFSWLCLKAGGYDIACKLLEKATKHPAAQEKTQEQLFMHLLMMRFFSHQYALIAESAFPEHFNYLEATEIKTLQFLKAYSATLSRNLNIANEFFNKCSIYAEMTLSDETSLYQLNIFALSRVLQGETDTAFKLEFRIQDFIEAQKIDVVGLKYVNFINIARLYKKTKEFTQSLAYYNKAYAQISGGGYTTSDHIYYNMNLGSLYEAAEDHQQALQYWIKAALHWLACDNKYGLSWRPRLILCSEKISDISKPLPIAKANAFLFDKINELLQACDIDVSHKTGHTCHFIEDKLHTNKELCFIHGNIVLYTSTKSTTKQLHHHWASEEKLAQLMSQYLQTSMDTPAAQDTFIIDTHLDSTPLRQAEEAIAYANLAHCTSCYFNGQWLKSDAIDSLNPMKASLSTTIHSMKLTDKGLAVQYKRSFLNKTLVDQAEIDLVKQLEQTQTINLANTPPAMKAMVHQLAQKRVVHFSYQN